MHWVYQVGSVQIELMFLSHIRCSSVCNITRLIGQLDLSIWGDFLGQVTKEFVLGSN